MAEPAERQPIAGHAQPTDDLVLAFRTLNSRAQGRIVRLGAAADEILGRHAYPEPVSQILGEALALTGMLGSLLHANGRLILQTKTDGPLSMLAVDFRAPGRMRGLASFDAARVQALMDGGKVTQGQLIGSGHLAMTIDTGGPEPRSQGIVALASNSIQQAALTYFRQSEQIPTFVRLAVARHSVRGADGAERAWHWRAGGLILQQLPEDVGHGGADLSVRGDERDDDNLVGDREEDWQRAHMLAQTVEDHELLDPTLTPEQLLYRLFAEEGVRVSEPVALAAHCGCTRDRVERLLKQFGADDMAEMREPDGGVTVTCEYCSTRYKFTADQVAAL